MNVRYINEKSTDLFSIIQCPRITKYLWVKRIGFWQHPHGMSKRAYGIFSLGSWVFWDMKMLRDLKMTFNKSWIRCKENISPISYFLSREYSHFSLFPLACCLKILRGMTVLVRTLIFKQWPVSWPVKGCCEEKFPFSFFIKLTFSLCLFWGDGEKGIAASLNKTSIKLATKSGFLAQPKFLRNARAHQPGPGMSTSPSTAWIQIGPTWIMGPNRHCLKERDTGF